MLTRSCLFASLLLSLHFYAKATSVCVARLHSGDVFVNEGGAIATCAEYGATCALGSELDGTSGGAEGDGLQCNCDVSEVLVPCPACRCNSIYPVFNGTNCEGGHITGWNFRNDLIDPHLNHSQALAINKAFSYPTKVYGWKMRVKNSRSRGGWMLLQIWRPKMGGFNLIASTNFSYGSSRGAGYTDTELPLGEDEWIRVRQGDIIGLFLSNGIKTAAAPFAFGLLSSSVIASGVVTGSSDMLFFTTADQDPPMELRTVDYDEHVTQFVINIQAVIGPPIEDEKQCLAQPVSIETLTEEDVTPSSKSNLPLDVEYVRVIVVPIVITLLFLIFLVLSIGITILCVRSFASARRRKVKREREERGNISLNTLDRRSVNNIYPPLGSLPRCTSLNSRNSYGVMTGSCADSLYEAIPDLTDHFTTSCSGSIPHTYATLECPPLYHETCSSTVPHFQVQEEVQADLDKSEKRLSTKDELTGQESEKDKLSEHDVGVTETSMNDDHPHEVEYQEQLDGVQELGMMEEEVGWEEISDFNGDEDSDHGFKIYNV